MLEPYRVVDLTNERGLLCGQVFGDLGAEVLQIEPPGGSTARRIGPFVDDEPHPDRSLFWWSFTRNKKSVALDVARAEGQEILHRLVAGADFLIDSALPGELAPLGLDPAATAKRYPKLIHVSITPFGQDGPKASWAAADLVLLAAAGPLALTGDADRPPLRISIPQAYLHGAAEAAGAALIANHERGRSGRGQHVDVSVQQAATLATQATILAAPVGWPDVERRSGGLKLGPLEIKVIFPAKDGFVAVTLLFGSAVGPFTRRLMEVVHEAGFCDEATRDKDWIGYASLLMSGQEPISEFERVKDVVGQYTASRTKEDLFAIAQERGLLMAPVTKIDEVVTHPQLASRDYWQDVVHGELGGRTVRYPGPFVKFSKTPLRWRLRPPTLGEHTDEVLGALGLDAAALARLRKEGIIR